MPSITTIFIIIAVFVVILSITRYTKVAGYNSPQNMYKFPKQYTYGPLEEDYAQSGLDYDSSGAPGYYVQSNGEFSQGYIPNGGIAELLKESKYQYLYEQQNFDDDTSPHTHIGKARGYITWEPTWMPGF